MNEWIDVNHKLPISGSTDDKFNGRWFEVEVEVMTGGKVRHSCFWACYDAYNSDKFLMEFDEDNVTHWRYKNKGE